MHLKKLTSGIGILFIFFSCEINNTPLESEVHKNNWIHLGLDSTSVNVLQMDRNGTLYASVWEDGIYQYVSNNKIWKLKNNGLANNRIQDFLISKNNYFYACSHSWTGRPGVYKSEDSGDNWYHIGLENCLLWCLAEDSKGKIFAGCLPELGTTNYVYRTDDEGNNWIGIDNPKFIPPGAAQISFDSADNIFVSSDYGGIYMLPSGDTMWVCIGLKDFSARQILITPNDEVFCYITQPTNSEFDFGFRFSSDSGKTWIDRTNSFPVIKPDFMTIDPEGNLYAYCKNFGLYSSNDNGINWKISFYQIDDNRVDYLYFGVDGYLYAGTGGAGVWRSKEAL